MISRRNFIKVSVAAGVAAVVPLAHAESASSAPNVIYIFPDEWRKSAIGFWQKEKYRNYISTEPDPVYTPNIDALADESIVFTHAVANQPLCSPMRAMLLSGAWPYENGVTGNCRSGRPNIELKTELICLPDVFRQAGYNTAYFGKCHWYGTRPEFDRKGTWLGKKGSHHYRRGGKIYDTFVPPGKNRHGIQYLFQTLGDDHYKTVIYEDDDRNSDPVHQIDNKGNFSTRTEADQILKYLKGKAGSYDPSKPLCMMWAPNPPHPKYDGPDEWIRSRKPYYGKMTFEETFVRKNVKPKKDGMWAIGKTRNKKKTLDTAHEYFAMVSEVDCQIGRLLDYLKTTDDPRNPGAKLEENTIIVITSDHGEMLNSQALSGKGKVFSESVDIPLLISWPAKLKPRVEESFFNVIDHLPTVAGLAGFSQLVPKTVRGRNLSELLISGRPELRQHSSLFISGSKRGLVTKKYSMVVTSNQKDGAPEVRIYDNINDPYQTKKLGLKDIPESVRKELISDFVSHLEKAKDPWLNKQLLEKLIK